MVYQTLYLLAYGSSIVTLWGAITALVFLLLSFVPVKGWVTLERKHDARYTFWLMLKIGTGAFVVFLLSYASLLVLVLHYLNEVSDLVGK